MKKFILVVLIALAPSFALADTIGCAAGGLLGGLAGSQVGGGVGQKIFTGLGLVMGCSAGSRIEDGTYGKNNAEEVVYVTPQSPYPPQYGYGNVVCDKTPKQGMYPPGPGLCNDPDYYGGETTYEELVRRAQRRAGYYQPPPAYYAPPQPVSYAPPQQISFPPSLWERSERKPAEQKKSAVVVGPTVSNYRDDPMVHPQCKTGNYGHDGKCLLDLVPALVREQKACENDGTKCYQYNSGKWAGIYQRLGNDLLDRQKEMQGGSFSGN